jgi:neutral ceramidase
VPLVLNGFCGNIHHSNHLDPSYVSTAARMGQCLTETAAGVFRGITYYPEDPVLDWSGEHLSLPIREIPDTDLAAAQALLRDHPEPMWNDPSHTSVAWDWVYAASVVDLAARRAKSPTYDLEVQVLRIGDIALVGLPGEPFVELQLRIKLQSPVRHTFMAHMCNGCVGYIPTRRAFDGGGYETRTCGWSFLAPEALELIEHKTVALLKDLFAK